MRNLFDQYKEPENRVTHALACSLERDRDLLHEFLGWVLGERVPRSRRITVLEQRIPGQPLDELFEPDERSGLPDLWFHDEDERWCLLGECKIADRLTASQLRRHARTALRQGFEDIALFTLTTDARLHASIPGAVHKSWSELYEWLHRRHLGSAWARELIDFLQIAEDRMAADGTSLASLISLGPVRSDQRGRRHRSAGLTAVPESG